MTTPKYRQVPAQVDLPALEHDVLDFWREQQDLRQEPRAVRGPPRVGLLRGPAHRQRHARRPPHRGPRLQGRLPALPHHEGLPRRPQGRLGLPRPAGRARRREGARLHRQAGHRGVRHRRVQRQVPRVGDPPHRRLRRAHDPHGLLGRPRRRVPDDGPRVHRVGLVVAQADLRQGPAGRGPPRRALVPALRHRPVRPRAGAGLRDGRRPVGVRPFPARPPARCAGAGALLVWTTTPWTLVSNTAVAVHPDVTYVARAERHGGGEARRRRSRCRRRPSARAGRSPAETFTGAEMERWTLSTSLRARSSSQRRGPLRGQRRVRDDRGRYGSGPPVPCLR